MASLKRRLAAAGAALAAALLLLAAVEGGLRAAGVAPQPRELPRNFDYWYVDVRRPFFRASPGPGGSRRLDPARRAAISESFLMPKPAGVTRVFVVGGSVAMPFTGDELLDRAFARLHPGARVEVVGTGMGGYDSERELGVLREILAYQPDLVVVMSGNNEYFGAPVRWPSLVKLSSAASRLALYRVFAGTARPLPSPDASERMRRFEDNLREMARLARRARVPIAFCALPANLRDSAPVTPVFLPLDSPDFFSAWTAWEDGDIPRAADLLGRRAAAAPGDAHARFLLARASERLGRADTAARAYAEAADLDQPGERTNPARAQIVRRVARDEGAILVDLADAFATLSPLGIPGGESMRDVCHWRRRYDPWVADLIVAAVARDERAPSSLRAADIGWPAPVRTGAQPEGEWNDALHSAFAKAVSAPPDQFWEEALLILERSRRARPEEFARVVASTSAIAALMPVRGFQDFQDDFARGREALWSHVAESLRRQGLRREADEAARRALAADPDSFRARLAAALASGSAGRPWEAAQAAEALARLEPRRDASRRAAGLWAAHWRKRAAGRGSRTAAR